MAHIHSVKDTDVHYKIDGITRTIVNVNETKRMLVQNDHNSERLTFEVPRYVDGHDLTTCNVVQVHYLNTDTYEEKGSSGVYEVDDLGIKENDENTVILTWLVSGNATKYIGTLNFIIRFSCVTNGNIDYAWNTTIFKGIAILEGLYNSDEVVEENYDILMQWKQELIAAGVDALVLDSTLMVEGEAADARATGDAIRELAKKIKQSDSGLTSTEKTLILALFRNTVYTSADMNATFIQLEALWNGNGNDDGGGETEATLSSIYATYSGGNAIVGTAVTNLTGVVVVAYYSDNSSKTVTDYTMYNTTGIIAEGNNKITVSYGGKTTTFTVVGIAKSDSGATSLEEITPSYLEVTSATFKSVGISDVDAMSTDMPNVLSIVAKNVQDYWSSGHRYELRTRTTQWSYTSYYITATEKTLTVDGVKYAIVSVTKEDYNAAYQKYLLGLESGLLHASAAFVFGNADNRFDATRALRYFSGEVNEEMLSTLEW